MCVALLMRGCLESDQHLNPEAAGVIPAVHVVAGKASPRVVADLCGPGSANCIEPRLEQVEAYACP